MCKLQILISALFLFGGCIGHFLISSIKADFSLPMLLIAGENLTTLERSTDTIKNDDASGRSQKLDCVANRFQEPHNATSVVAVFIHRRIGTPTSHKGIRYVPSTKRTLEFVLRTHCPFVTATPSLKIEYNLFFCSSVNSMYNTFQEF